MKDNLDKYSFANAPSLEQESIEDVAKYMCSRSNDHCKSYFKMIGIE